MSSCTIQLDHFQGHYFTGSTISGNVVCTFRKTKNIRGIKLTLKGKEYTSWTEWESFRDPHKKETRRRAVHYHGENKFYRIETGLGGAGEIGPGIFQYPFTLALPKNLPGTYYGKYGWVKYHIKVTVDRVHNFDYQDMREIVVISLVDFNDMLGQLPLNPVVYSVDKTLCCCCCASGPIMMAVHLNKEAFVLGETVTIPVEITNTSDKDIDSVSIELGMKVESRVTIPRTKVKQEYQPLAISKDVGLGAHSEKTYTFMLHIPAIAGIPNFNLCTLFTQWCKLKVVAVLPSPHKNLKSSSRVIMGHIPVGQHAQLQISSYLPAQAPVNAYQHDADSIYCDITPYASSEDPTGRDTSSFAFTSSNVSSLGPSASAVEAGPSGSEGPVHLYSNVSPYLSSVSTITPSPVPFTYVKPEPVGPNVAPEDGSQVTERDRAKTPPPSYDEAVSPQKENPRNE